VIGSTVDEPEMFNEPLTASVEFAPPSLVPPSSPPHAAATSERASNPPRAPACFLNLVIDASFQESLVRGDAREGWWTLDCLGVNER
jgi:hypothetical protein